MIRLSLLIYAAVAVSLGIFCALMRLCQQAGVSPLFGAALFIGACAAGLWKLCREAQAI